MSGPNQPRRRPAHLLCGQRVWGVAVLAAGSYFSYLSYLHVQRAAFGWKHDAWSMATYAVWVLLLAGLTFAIQCLRERLFYGLLLVNFAMGFGLTVWSDASLEAVRGVRIISTVVWALAAVAGFVAGLSPVRQAESKVSHV